MLHASDTNARTHRYIYKIQKAIPQNVASQILIIMLYGSDNFTTSAHNKIQFKHTYLITSAHNKTQFKYTYLITSAHNKPQFKLTYFKVSKQLPDITEQCALNLIVLLSTIKKHEFQQHRIFYITKTKNIAVISLTSLLLNSISHTHSSHSHTVLHFVRHTSLQLSLPPYSTPSPILCLSSHSHRTPLHHPYSVLSLTPTPYSTPSPILRFSSHSHRTPLHHPYSV